MKPFSAPSVSIDGESIRRLREEGRLTQLYVAKVVGVTTDTVSRWENNRYPTIRRDNALKLAEALEVDLEQILRQDDGSGDDVGLEEGASSSRGLYLYALIGAVLLIAVVVLWLRRDPQTEGQVLLQGHRFVPKYAAPGTRVPIRLEIDPGQTLKGLIIREEFPQGWLLVESDPPPASLDNLNGSVRWMLRNPPQSKVIVYVLKAPDNLQDGALIELKGEVVANPDGQRFVTQIASNGALEIAPLHWADANGNSKIDDLEILDVSDLVDESGRIHYEWELIEKLWDAGAYRFDRKNHLFVPRKVPESSATSSP